MKFYDKRKMAQKVLAGVLAAFKDAACDSAVVIGSYANQREQGVSLSATTEAGDALLIIFSENRSSNEIVVYIDRESSILVTGHEVTDEMYDDRELFETTEEAVKAIVKTMKEELNIIQ